MVSKVPMTRTAGSPSGDSGRIAPSGGSLVRRDPPSDAAAASKPATGTGFDQRVGGAGFDIQTRPAPWPDTSRTAGASRGCATASSGSGTSPPWRPTPRRRCWSSRSVASTAASMTRWMRPFTMIAVLSDTAVATPMFCSITSTEISSSSPIRISMSSTCCTITGASPSVGSSITSRRGLSSRAREIASICCSPPESCPPRLVRRSASRGNASWMRSRVHPPRPPRSHNRRCSSTVSDAHRRLPCGTYPTPWCAIRLGPRPASSSPSNWMDPRAIGTSPMIALHSVVLPMPLRPTTDTTPCGRSRSTPCSAWD